MAIKIKTMHIQIIILVVAIIVGLLYLVPITESFEKTYVGTVYDMNGNNKRTEEIKISVTMKTRLLFFKEIVFDLKLNDDEIVYYHDPITLLYNIIIDRDHYLYIAGAMQHATHTITYPVITRLYISEGFEGLVVSYMDKNNKQYIFFSDLKKNRITRSKILKYIGL